MIIQKCKEIKIMAMTNAERQKRYRSRMMKAGLKRNDTWTDREGLLAPASETGAWMQMTLKEMGKEINKRFAVEWEREAVYAELFEYAKRIESKLKKAFSYGNVTGNE
jgi:hypothetical protein